MANKFTRRRLLTTLGAGAISVALANTLGCKVLERTPKVTPLPEDASSASAKGVWAFRSRPELGPPFVEVTTLAQQETAPGYIFVASKKGGSGPGGSMILDDRGEVVWFRPTQQANLSSMDFKVQHYKGEPVLTWWEGLYGSPDLSEYGILDSSYREIARLRAGNGYRGDHHEFLITPQDTALITIYNPVPWDLSRLGGSKDSIVYEGVVQELDIESGEVLFEWHSLEHVGLEESYVTPSEDGRPGLDYFHINSIDVDHDDNLLISARSTSAVYKIERNSGEIMWRLGGKRSDFQMGEGASFSYQHDARRQPDGTITIFDNGDTTFDEGGVPKAVEESRGIVLELDEQKMSASLVREYTHPEKQFAHAAGNMQVLPNENVFIGWGRALVFSEFSEDGELLFNASFPSSFSAQDGSYRAFRYEWSGHPEEKPAAVAERTSEEELKLYASWNGATEVSSWEVVAGPGPDQLKPVGSVGRQGFETAMLVQSGEPYVGVRARGRSGEVLGSSEAIEL
jgi:Arylsulfotransferase (ASST)